MAKQSLGLIIRNQRKDIGITAEELGRRVGVTRTYISKIERGSMRPSHRIILDFKKALRLGDEFLEAYYAETRPDIVAFFNKKMHIIETKHSR